MEITISASHVIIAVAVITSLGMFVWLESL